MRKTFLIVLCLLLVACGGDNNEDTCDPHIGLLGDSLTWLGGWPDLLAQEYDVRRHAFPGFSTADWLPGSEAYEAEQFTACSYIVLLGTNDAGLGTMRSADEFKFNLRKIAWGLWLEGAEEVILLTPPPVFTDGIVGFAVNLRLKEYERVIHEICDETNEDHIVCGPDLQIGVGPGFFVSDGIHFSALGAVWVFEQVFGFLEAW